MMNGALTGRRFFWPALPATQSLPWLGMFFMNSSEKKYNGRLI